ncbi:MFS transporter [Pseudobdellovibrio sp. HCB154]|uniref:MFS transporter n=1 Tax=Pseudobdellovibrio sp. HCB154 TaxID=3386277 RepID=UPI0039175A20
MDDVKQITGKLWFSYVEALLTSLVVGFAETYFAAFSLQQGNSPLQSGLLVSLPLIFAAILQFALQTKLKNVGLSYFVSRALMMQSLALLGLGCLSLIKTDWSFFYLMFFYSIYWLGHFSIQPAWNRWISDIIPLDEGQNYFSLRTRLSQIGIIAGLFGGGAMLHMDMLGVPENYLFFWLFAGCFALKILIVQLFRKHPPHNRPLFLDKNHFKSLFTQNTEFFKRYATFNTALFISAPFVAAYLLSVRNVGYFNFMLITGSLFVGKVVTTYYLKHAKKQFDPHQMLVVGGLVAGPLPMLWPICQSVPSMMILQLVSGMGWASWEMGLSLYFFSRIQGEKKIELVSLYNYIGVFTQVIGTILGALVFSHLLGRNFDILFVVAGIIRFIAVLGLRKPRLVS